MSIHLRKNFLLGFSVFFLIFLGGCQYDLQQCSSYSGYLEAIISLVRQSYSILFPLFVFIWAAIIARKIFFV